MTVRGREEALIRWIEVWMKQPHGFAEVAAKDLLQILFGGNFQDVKPEEPIIQRPTQETVTTELSSFLWELGTVLEVLDTLINSLMKCKSNLQSSYNYVMAGIPGLSAQNASISDD